MTGSFADYDCVKSRGHPDRFLFGITNQLTVGYPVVVGSSSIVTIFLMPS